MWPDRLTSAFPPSSLHEPIKARERSRRSGPVTTHPDRIQPFRGTNGSTVPHSDADFAHQICGRDFVHAAIILKGTCVSLPQAPLHTNVISAVTQAAFTGRKAEGGGTAAIVHPVFTDVSHNYIFITEPFCRIANISVTFHSATVGNLFFSEKEPGFLSAWKYFLNVFLVLTFEPPPSCRSLTVALAGDWHSFISVLPGE